MPIIDISRVYSWAGAEKTFSLCSQSWHFLLDHFLTVYKSCDLSVSTLLSGFIHLPLEVEGIQRSHILKDSATPMLLPLPDLVLLT